MKAAYCDSGGALSTGSEAGVAVVGAGVEAQWGSELSSCGL